MRATASKVGLLEHCQWWARDDAQQDPRRSSEAAERGTRFHEAIARFIETGKLESYEEDIAGEMAVAIEWLHARRWTRDMILVEQAYGWNPETDEAVRYDVTGRGYPDDGLVHGTADLVICHDEGTAFEVYDWKTGDGSGAGSQLRALGLAVARFYGADEATVSALEVKPSGVTEVCRETLDSFALAAVAGELAERIAAVPTAEPVPGSHCGELYCPARLSCPVGNAAAAELVDIIPATELMKKQSFRITDPIQTPEHAAWALDVMRMVTAKLDAIKDDIKAKIPADGWTLEDGRVLRETKATVPAFDKHKALALVKQLGATEAQIASLNYTFEKSNGLRVSGGASKPRTRRKTAA